MIGLFLTTSSKKEKEKIASKIINHIIDNERFVSEIDEIDESYLIDVLPFVKKSLRFSLADIIDKIKRGDAPPIGDFIKKRKKKVFIEYKTYTDFKNRLNDILNDLYDKNDKKITDSQTIKRVVNTAIKHIIVNEKYFHDTNSYRVLIKRYFS